MRKLMIAGIMVCLTAAISRGATDYSNTIRELSPWITNQLQVSGASSLALALVDSNQIVWATGFGLADPLTGQTADADTVYRIASVSKTFVALTAMRWVDRGQLPLDVPVTNWVPTFSFRERFPGAPPITPRLLMNHQSGLPGDYTPYAQTTVSDLRYGQMVLEMFADEYPVYPPNFSDTYNNNGFTLMEAVLAALSGTTFVDHVTAYLLQPLDMTVSTFLYDTNRFNGKLARSMIGANAYPDEIVNVHGSGGLYSTVNEMAHVIEMLLSGGVFGGQRLLTTNALETMWTFQGTNVAVSSSNPDFQSGLGWDNVADPKLAYAGRACFKGGDSDCFHSHLEVMPERGLGIAVMCNGGSLAQATAQRALMYALRDKFGLPIPTNTAPFPDSPVVTNPPLPWDQLAGYYAREGGVVRVVATNGSLALTLDPFGSTNFPYANLAPHSNGWFWTAGNTNAQIAFSNVAAHQFLMVKSNKGTYWNMQMLGERITPAPLSTVWMNRALSTWIAADLDPFDFRWAQNAVQPLTFAVANGFLFFNNFTFAPTNDNLAFPFIAGRNDAGALKVVNTNGEEWLRVLGVHYRAIENLPVLTAPGLTNAVLAGDVIGWYRIPRSGSGFLELTLAGAPQPQLRVLNDRFQIIATGQPRILAAPTGTAYVAVTRGLNGGGAYTLRAFWRRVAADYDGDGKADPAVYNAAGTLWGVCWSSSGYAQIGSLAVGAPAVVTAAEDYDGDGKMDPAVYRAADGAWAIYFSGSRYVLVTLNGFGAADAIPAPADYDGDGKADPAVYRAADGTWAFKFSTAGYAATQISGLGAPGWTAAVADYDGDGKADPAVYRAADGAWIFCLSGNGYAATVLSGFGAADAIPAVADYDGDGKADPAVYRAADGLWAIKLSASGYASMLIEGFGGLAWTAAAADYDGDGKTDPAGYCQSAGVWACMLSASAYAVQIIPFGGPDYPPAR